MKQCPNPICKELNTNEADFCHACGTRLSSFSKKYDSGGNNEDVDNKILDIIKQNSFSVRPLAAYEARKYANNICKESFGKNKKNYREYVEMLMVQHYPKELEKSNLGRQFTIWMYTSIALCVCGIGIIISPFIIWKILIPTYKQLKTMCK